MGKNTKISWTDHTFNPWWGCTKVSEGCANCYAEAMSKRFGDDVWGPGKPRKMMSDKYWDQPLKWNARAEREGIRRKVFAGSMCDFAEDDLTFMLDGPRFRLGTLINETPWLDWLLLTKRAENLVHVCHAMGFTNQVLPCYGNIELPNNVWLGVSAEDQPNFDKRVRDLLPIPAPVSFVSLEPLLGPIDLGLLGTVSKDISPNYSMGYDKINWVIVGGESGPNARPMNLDWARDIRDQCQAAGVPFYFKQVGGYPNKRENLEDIPEDLRIREWPEG